MLCCTTSCFDPNSLRTTSKHLLSSWNILTVDIVIPVLFAPTSNTLNMPPRILDDDGADALYLLLPLSFSLVSSNRFLLLLRMVSSTLSRNSFPPPFLYGTICTLYKVRSGEFCTCCPCLVVSDTFASCGSREHTHTSSVQCIAPIATLIAQ